ncbi:type II toxin-antitoxin system RelE/ParE family toxin [Duganella sp. P38]|uniref:type II toxin-antitoxin system RelE/ParE family toxin n=1 Tax=Duganella sp. P38 TaxID=3423949 RepID=UPI003D78B718
MADQHAKPGSLHIRWSPRAEAAYENSLKYIAAQDVHAAVLVTQRVERALAVIQRHPETGTLMSRGLRRFPVPGTGYLIDYHVIKGEIRITRWARHTRKA